MAFGIGRSIMLPQLAERRHTHTLALIKGHKAQSYVIKSHNVTLVNLCANSCSSHTNAKIKKRNKKKKAALWRVAVLTGNAGLDRNIKIYRHGQSCKSFLLYHVPVCFQ